MDPSLQEVFIRPLGAGDRVLELSLSPFLICRQVYGASNVELITRTRTEHLSEQHKGKVKGNEAVVEWQGRGGVRKQLPLEYLHQYSL